MSEHYIKTEPGENPGGFFEENDKPSGLDGGPNAYFPSGSDGLHTTPAKRETDHSNSLPGKRAQIGEWQQAKGVEDVQLNRW